MNSLSWFLYAADAIGNVSAMVTGFGALFTIAGVIGTVLWLVAGGCKASDQKQEWYGRSPDTLARNQAEWDSWISSFAMLKKFLKYGVVFLILGALMPSRPTIYAMAASELGDRLLQTDTAKEITNDATKALQQWIKRQIEPQKKAAQ